MSTTELTLESIKDAVPEIVTYSLEFPADLKLRIKELVEQREGKGTDYQISGGTSTPGKIEIRVFK